MIIDKLFTKYRSGGMRAIGSAVLRKLLPIGPKIPPVQVALDEVTSRDGFVLVQLGAYIGNTITDPFFRVLCERLKRFNGTVVLVEPVKAYFDKLVSNYRGLAGIQYENVAIAERGGEASFYRLGVDPTCHGFPEWLAELGSLKEERMGVIWDMYEGNWHRKYKAYQEFLYKHKVEENVQCITFEDLMVRHGLAEIDLLQIDVEGCELEILRSIDFEKYPIRFINYESVLLQSGKGEAAQLMKNHGYRLVDFHQDTFCYRDCDRGLAKCWSR